MQKVMIYLTGLCPFCWRAKRLLDIKGVDYEEIDIMVDPERRVEMIRRAGGLTSVPQVFIGDMHVGGSDELLALDQSGTLDSILIERR